MSKKMQFVLTEKSQENMDQLKVMLNISSSSDLIGFVLQDYLKIKNSESDALIKDIKKTANKIDKTAQIQTEMLNSLILASAVRDFSSTETMPSAVYKKSVDHINAKIAYIKQINDDRKHSD